MRRLVVLLAVLIVFVGVPASPVAQEASPEAGGDQETIAGTALDLLTMPDTGELSLIAVGELEGGSIPVVVRNDTDRMVTDIRVKANARASDGSLLGVGETSPGLDMKPTILRPGEISIGFVLMQGDIPADATFDFVVTHGERGSDFRTDLAFVEVAWLGDRVVGELKNPGSKPVEYMYLTLMCFDSAGTPFVADPAGVQEVVRPGDSTTFQIGEFTRGIERCDRFLVAGYGNHQN